MKKNSATSMKRLPNKSLVGGLSIYTLLILSLFQSNLIASPDFQMRFEDGTGNGFQDVAGEWIILKDKDANNDEKSNINNGTYNILLPVIKSAENAEALLTNISVYNYSVSNWPSILLTVQAKAKETGSHDDNFAIVFGYKDTANYYFLSFSEQNDNNCNGIFKVSNGRPTELIDFQTTIFSETIYSIRLIADERSISVFLNDVSIAHLNNITSIEGKVGVGTHAKPATFDNLFVLDRYTSQMVVRENFNFPPLSELAGKWGIVKGEYKLITPNSDSSKALNNQALVDTTVTGDFRLEVSAILNQNSYQPGNFAVIFDWKDTSNYNFISFDENKSTGLNGIFKVSNGEISTLADFPASIQAISTQRVKIERVNNRVRVYLDDQFKASAEIEGASGKIGLGSRNYKIRFDNLTIWHGCNSMEVGPAPANVEKIDGVWEITCNQYKIKTPHTNSTSHLNNRLILNNGITGDFNLSVYSKVIGTASRSNDFAVLFNFEDANNYYYAIFSESSASDTNGVFKVSQGNRTRIASFSSTIRANATYKIIVQRIGDTIKIYRDGKRVASFISPINLGKVGFGSKSDKAIFSNIFITSN
jgi:hypothetical protein